MGESRTEDGVGCEEGKWKMDDGVGWKEWEEFSRKSQKPGDEPGFLNFGLQIVD